MKWNTIAKQASGEFWVTTRYWDFIQNQRNVEAERDALVKIMTRPPRVRINTFSASGAGRCLRERQLAYMGAKKTAPDEKAMNIFANGDYVHLRYQVGGIVGGWLKGAEVSVSYPELNMTGTMDGENIDETGLEIKSINTRGFDEVSAYGVKPEHEEQVHSYMLARPDLKGFRFVYENKNDQRIKEFFVPRKEALITKVKDDLTTLNEANAAHVMLPMLPECVEGRGRFARCPYRKVCPLARFASAQERKSPIRVVSSRPSPSSD